MTSDNYWHKTTTGKYRYDALGIINYMYEYAKRSDKHTLVVIDVGCSKAVATHFAKTCLNGRGINSFMVGIDNSIKIVEDAEKNLGEFILNDVMDVKRYYRKADVVICSKVIRNVDGTTKSKVLGKCTKFLKDDGVLITDVEGYGRSISKRGLESLEQSEPKQLLNYSRWDCIFGRIWCWKGDRKRTKMMDKHDALKYAGQIKEEWNSLSKWEKFKELSCLRLLKIFFMIT